MALKLKSCQWIDDSETQAIEKDQDLIGICLDQEVYNYFTADSVNFEFNF
jgi:hypothetical protein